MKIKTTELTFKAVTIELTFETLGELSAFYARLNVCTNTVLKNEHNLYPITENDDRQFNSIFNTIKTLLENQPKSKK